MAKARQGMQAGYRGKSMHRMIDPVEAEWLGTVNTALVEEDVPATITTTLYDLIAAIRTAVAPDDDPLVVATVVHILRSRRVTFLGDPEELARWAQEPSRGSLSSPLAPLPPAVYLSHNI